MLFRLETRVSVEHWICDAEAVCLGRMGDIERAKEPERDRDRERCLRFLTGEYAGATGDRECDGLWRTNAGPSGVLSCDGLRLR